MTWTERAQFLKSRLKKYLPKPVYRVAYVAYGYFDYFVHDKTESLRLIEFTAPVVRTIRCAGVSFEIKLDPDNGAVDKEIYSKGAWEPQILEEIARHLHKKAVCLDVGANIGQHTLLMATVASEGEVYAFEPLENLVNQIKESVRLNGCQNVEVLSFGLSNTNEDKPIYLDNLNLGRTTFDQRSEASSKAVATVRVFDEFWAERSLIDFIKMDVEGYEHYALQGMRRSLAKYHPTILVEFTPPFYKKMGIDSRDILNFAFDLNYRVYDLDHGRVEVTRDGIEEFLQRVTVQTNLLYKWSSD